MKMNVTYFVSFLISKFELKKKKQKSKTQLYHSNIKQLFTFPYKNVISFSVLYACTPTYIYVCIYVPIKSQLHKSPTASHSIRMPVQHAARFCICIV